LHLDLLSHEFFNFDAAFRLIFFKHITEQLSLTVILILDHQNDVLIDKADLPHVLKLECLDVL